MVRPGMLLLLLVFVACNNGTSDSKPAKADSLTRIGFMQDVLADPKHSPADSFLDPYLRAYHIHLGDFDTMMAHRMIRVLVPYSRTLFFNDKGRERGITADNFREFETFLNKKYRKKNKNIPFTVVFIPTRRDRLIPYLMKGLGELAAGNLTATEERLKLVDFMAPRELGMVSEIVLTRKTDSSIKTTADLSGKTVHVRRSSSYYESLQRQNKLFTAGGKKPIALEIVSEDLEDEDLMEMLNAGIIKTIVVDDWKARMWAQVLPDIRLNKNAAVSEGGYIGFAYRKNSPLLAAELHDFYYNHGQKQAIMSYRFARYSRQVKSLHDPTDAEHARRYKEIKELFDKYGHKYSFDPLMLVALGFQESELDQRERSHVGAIGVMQVMPQTGRAMRVGSVTITENNIHAGTKYLRWILTHYFKDAHLDDFNRSLFSFASYNAGAARISRLRKETAARGLNPDVWLNNVEIIASEKIGRETTTYVRNIVKYYYSYKLMQERARAIVKK